MTRKAAYLYGARGKTFLSGSPYYLARALEALGRQSGAFEVVDLPPRRTGEIPFTYLRWCLQARSRRVALFLLSRLYHDRCARDLTVPDGVRPYFIVWGQCVPASILAQRRLNRDARIIIYTDATLLDLAGSFDYAADLPPALLQKMLHDERESYAGADLITVFHDGVRRRLVADYGVPPEKIVIIGRGANLDCEGTSRMFARRRSARDRKLHLMIVGREPRRKGVFRLIEAIDALSPEEQERLVLTVAGPKMYDLPGRPYLRPLGFLPAERRHELAAEMASSDLGVLLSEAEGLPGSVWEFLALGVPVWVSRLPDLEPAIEGYPVIFEDLSPGIPALVKRLLSFLHEPYRLAAVVAARTKSTAALSWSRPAGILARYIIDGEIETAGDPSAA